MDVFLKIVRQVSWLKRNESVARCLDTKNLLALLANTTISPVEHGTSFMGYIDCIKELASYFITVLL